ncbi:MAG: hypothetical protein WCJ58_03215 [bacterium]
MANEDFRDIADRISAAEQNGKAAWREGDTILLNELGGLIKRLQNIARNKGATPESHPGIFNVSPIFHVSDNNS